MHSLKLISLQCHVSDESDLDEIYLKHDGNKIWPQSEKYKRIDPGSVSLNVSIPDAQKDSILEIELWDYDTLSRNDKLGNFSLQLDEYGKYQTELKRHGNTPASYSLEWEYY